MSISPEDAVERVRAIFGNETTVQQVKQKVDYSSDTEIVDTLTRVCYFYPQYDLKAVEELTNSQVNALLIQAEKQRATEFYNLTLITAAPHTEKGKLVDKLIERYRDIIES